LFSHIQVNDYSLIFEWKGANSTLQPGLLMSHMDVVPVADTDVPKWSQDPFGGAVTDGFIWGRGALDVKITLVAILEAVEELLAAGFEPERTLLLAFGHDEETGGTHGAKAIVRRLRERGITQLHFVLDEGGVVLTDGFPPLTRKPVAAIGTAEKGQTTVEMSIATAGGHASMPPLDGSSVGSIAARILSRLDRSPINPGLVAPASDMLAAFAPEAPFYLRPLLRLAHNGLFGVLLAQVMGAMSPEASAMTRTTVAVTSLEAGVAHNVLPQEGRILFNSRVLPGETCSGVVNYLNATGAARDANRVSLRVLSAQEPSPVSDSGGPVFETIRRAILEVLPSREGEMVVVPHLVAGATDSRHYTELTEDIFRFAPLMMNKTAGDLARIHGNNERVRTADFLKAIRFYMRFIRLAFARAGV